MNRTNYLKKFIEINYWPLVICHSPQYAHEQVYLKHQATLSVLKRHNAISIKHAIEGYLFCLSAYRTEIITKLTN